MKLWLVVAVVLLATSSLLPIFAQKQQGNNKDTAVSTCENELGQCTDNKDTYKCMSLLANLDCPEGKQCCKTFLKDYDAAGLPMKIGTICNPDPKCKSVGGNCIPLGETCEGKNKRKLCKSKNCTCCYISVDEKIINLGSAIKGVDEKIINLGSAMKGVNETIINLESATKGVDEKIINLESATKGLDEKIINLESAMKGSEAELLELKQLIKSLVVSNQEIKQSVFQMKDFLNGTCVNTKTFTNCAELLAEGMDQSGVYSITPKGFSDGVEVYCDQTTDGGGWTVFLQRKKQSNLVNFARTFEEYATGFGYLKGEFWMGNRVLHAITGHKTFTLRVEAKNPEGESRTGIWEAFSVGSEDTKFTLSLHGYSKEDSTLGDSLVMSNGNNNINGMKFSAMDQDNDRHSGDCSGGMGKGGWWFNICGFSNPTGPFGGGTFDWNKACWYIWKPSDSSSPTALSEIQFKIRPRPPPQ